MITDDIIVRLQEVADRLSAAPAVTEDAARRDVASRRARNPNDQIGHYAHQSGGLSMVCEIAARDLEALIRRLQRDGAS